MLDAQEIRSTVDSLILDAVKVSGAKDPAGKSSTIEPQMELNKDFGLDSLDILELVSTLETRCDVEMSDDVFTTVKTVDDLYKYMSVTLAKKS